MSGQKKVAGGWHRLGGQEHPHRVADDLYPTPPEATQCLLKHIKYEGAIWECASGLGDISEEFIQAGYEVISTDLCAERYGYGEVLDFLDCGETRAPNIVTNPPYALLREFLRRCFTLPGVNTVTVLIPLPTIALVHMRKFFQEFGAPAQILVLTPTLKIYMGEERGVQQSMFTHCWVYWNLEGEKRDSSELKLVNWKEK